MRNCAEIGKIANFGAISSSVESMHEASLEAIRKFLLESDYLCGHNIIEHDMKYLNKHIGQLRCEGVKNKQATAYEEKNNASGKAICCINRCR